MKSCIHYVNDMISGWNSILSFKYQNNYMVCLTQLFRETNEGNSLKTSSFKPVLQCIPCGTDLGTGFQSESIWNAQKNLTLEIP